MAAKPGHNQSHHHHGVKRKRRHSVLGAVPGPFGLKLLDSAKSAPRQVIPISEPHEVTEAHGPQDEQELKEHMLTNVLLFCAALVLGPLLVWVAYRLVVLSYLLKQ